jgi:hypothetical protein
METPDQPAAPESMTDRIAAKFGITDEPEQTQEAAPEAPEPEVVETPDPEAAPAEEFVEVEYAGQRCQVPKFLEKAILQEKDYTQKTQTVAQKQREFEALQEQGRLNRLNAEFNASVENEITQLRAFDSVLENPIDWATVPDSDVPRMLAQRAQWKEQREQLARTLSQKQTKFQQSYEQALGEAKAKARDAISKAIPNFSDDVLKSIREHAKSDGYTDVELNAVDMDPRHVKTLYKAAQYDKLMASKAQAVQTATKAPPMVKPGTQRPMSQAVKDEFAIKKAIKSSTNSSDKAKNIQKLLEGRF